MTDTSTAKCEAGCVSFDGGEKRHNPHCAYYPESFTRLFDETAAERDALRAENERLRAGADAIGFWMSAALEDPNVSDKMKSDINTFFDALDPPQPAALATKGGA